MTADRKATIRDHMDAAHAKILATLDSLSEDQWDVPVYSDEHDTAWTVRDLIAHLADSTKGQLRTVRMITSGEDPVPADFDLARWNRRALQKAADTSNADLAAAVRDNYQAWLHFLDEIPQADLDRKGRHPGGQTLTVEDFMRRFTTHEANHAADIQTALTRSAA